MYVIRQAKIDDLPILMKLARMVHFINLPADEHTITEKVLRSRDSFADRLEDTDRGVYMFMIEDVDSGGGVLGTSQIVARMGFPEAPNTYFQLRTREMYADDLQFGARHITLQLGADTDGPTEIGGLILQPAYRGHAEKLGKQLSLIRFHYIGLHRDQFRDEILAEMMAPLDSQGSNAFWEYLGRRFINLSYNEADRLSTKTKNFILSLMPKEEIYLSILPPEARMLVGRVGAETEPAKALLERLGFEYRDHVDPFDGGPHLHARTADIPVVRDTSWMTLGGACPKSKAKGELLVSFEAAEGFQAVRAPGVLANGGDEVRLPREAMNAIGAEAGARVGVTPLVHPAGVARGAGGASPSKRRSKATLSRSSRSSKDSARIAAKEGAT